MAAEQGLAQLPWSDGKSVAFESRSAITSGDIDGIVHVFVRTVSAGTTTMVSAANNGAEASSPATNPAISSDGRYVAFRSQGGDLVVGDTNDVADVFVRDLVANTDGFRRGGWHSDHGSERHPSISADGST